MSLVNNIIVQEFAYGNPASLGEPRGLWAGEANITGDASGGNVLTNFLPENPVDVAGGSDHRREFIYFVDGIMIIANTDPGNLGAVINTHMARANVALATRYDWRINVSSITNGSSFAPIRSLTDVFTSRLPVFWDTQELDSGGRIIVSVFAETNTVGTVYNVRCYGRYYDRQVLFNRSFGRLVAPPPLAPFD